MIKKGFAKFIIFLLLPISISAFSQRIAIIGDYRSAGPGVDSVGQLVRNWSPDAVITTGDNYDLTDGTLDDQVGKNYSSFIYPYYGNYVPGGSTNTFFPCLGNHDILSNGLQEYFDYFTLPGNERYYTIQFNNLMFFVINSNPSEADGIADTSAQAIWLQSQLALAGSSWKIVVFHHPPYTSGAHPPDSLMRWPFEDWGADAVICGHNHGYERLSVNGFPYFVNASGGATLYSFNPVPESQISYSLNWGAMMVQPYEDSLMLDFYNIRDSLVDKYVIYKTVSVTEAVLEAYPDITQNNLNLFLKGINKGEVNIEIYDADGKSVIKSNDIIPLDRKCSVSIAGLNSGVYIVKVYGHSFNAAAKFVVIH